VPWPRIVAESLRHVRRAGEVVAPPPARALLATTVAALCSAAAPPRSRREPPAFLHGHQVDSWRRVLAALDSWGGALLLDPVGAGKTWVALGIAAAEPGGVVAIVPAILRAQWRAAALRASVPIELWTHERASRGQVPVRSPALVIIDEAHRLRDPATRRVKTIAPWLVGRRALLLTATPIVNRARDMIALLRLVLPEAALDLDGINALGDLEHCGTPPDALRRVAVRTAYLPELSIRRAIRQLDPDGAERERGARAVAAIGQLTLSERPAIRRLLTTVLLDAAASSDAAFGLALRRYRALLLQAQDAGGASRAMLRRFAGESLEQLVFWPLVNDALPHGELPLADIARVEQLLGGAPDDDRWIDGLRADLSGPRPTICFTRHCATAQALRRAFGDGVAWINGSEAGIGAHRLPREVVLAAFGPGRPDWVARRDVPRLLVATDVAAEGLDLQAAGRIVHADLPWTATRLEQREGRLARLGQQHPEVEVLVRMPSPAIEAALAANARVRRKRRLADDWLTALEGAPPAPARSSNAPPVTVLHDSGEPAMVVAVQRSQGRRCGTIWLHREPGGRWAALAAPLARVIARSRTAAVCTETGPDIAALLAEASRAALMLHAARTAAATTLVSRIHHLARRAAARRDGTTLRRLDRLLRFATCSPTLGMRILVARLSAGDDQQLLGAIVPDVPAAEPLHAVPVAALIFRRNPGPHSATCGMACSRVRLP